MMRVKVWNRMPQSYRLAPPSEPNHRQEMALERIEFAVGELATVLLANCRSHGAAGVAISELRRAVAPAIAEILSEG
jgi:hypothetical protein